MNVAAAPIEPTDGAKVPHNVETEAALLGALMMANNLIDDVADRLTPEHFFEPVHGHVFALIVRERALGRVASPVTLARAVSAIPRIEELGGPGYLAQLTGSGAGIIGVKEFVAEIIELARLRRLQERFQSVLADIEGSDKSYAQIVADAETSIVEASDETEDGSNEASMGQFVKALLKSHESGESGVTTGIEGIDEAIGALKLKQNIVLAGRPGMGKTAAALSIALGLARQGHGVLFVSKEMSGEQLAARAASEHLFNQNRGVLYSAIETGRMSAEQARAVARAAAEIEDLPLQVLDLPPTKIGRVNMMVRRWKRRFAARGVTLRLVVIDYMQLCLPDERCDNRTQEITKVSIGCKAIAKSQDVTVLALAQLSRETEKRQEKRPTLSDLRDSGQIEQDADAVLFLYREEYYLAQSKPDEMDPRYPAWQETMERYAGQIEYICAKRRNGPTGIQRGRFHGAFMAVR